MRGLTSTEHRALKAIAVQFFVNGAVVASYVPRLPRIRDDLGISLATIGLIMAVATSFGVFGSVIQGPVVARFGTRTSMIWSGAFLVAFLPLVAFTGRWWTLLLVLGVISISDVITDVSMNMQGSVLSARRDVPVMNRLHAMWSLGTVVGGLTASIMAALDVDLRIHLLGAGLVLGLTLIYVAPGLLRADEQPTDAPTATSSSRATGVVVTFAALGAAAILPEMINSDWAAFRLADDLDASDGVAGIAYVSFTTGMVTARFAGDAIVQRFGSAVMLQRATVLAATGTLIATMIPAVVSVFVGLFIAGLGVSIMFPQLYDAAARHERPGRALGGLTAGTRMALLGAPLAVGVMADSDVFSVGAAIAVTTVPATILVLVLSNRLFKAP